MNKNHFHLNKHDIKRILLTVTAFTVLAIAISHTAADLYAPILIDALLAVCILLYLTHLYRRHLAHQIYDSNIKDNYKQIEALFNIFSPYRFEYPLPEMRRWAVSPDALLYLLRTAIQHQARSIVECGSGVSTIILAKYAKENGEGHVFSLDHDEVYAEKTRQMLRLHSLDSFATVITAPLAETTVDNKTYTWYSVHALAALPTEIDMIFVDGPPAPEGSFNRYPALQMLESRMHAECRIVMDDIIRKDELEISKLWATRMGRTDVTYLDVEKRMAII